MVMRTGQSRISGRGAFAEEPIKAGVRLDLGFKKIKSTGNPDEDYERTELGSLVNHADNPNLELDHEDGHYYFKTKTPVNKDDELTLDYDQIPWEGKRDFDKQAGLFGSIRDTPAMSKILGKRYKPSKLIAVTAGRLGPPIGGGDTGAGHVTPAEGIHEALQAHPAVRAGEFIPDTAFRRINEEEVKKFPPEATPNLSETYPGNGNGPHSIPTNQRSYQKPFVLQHALQHGLREPAVTVDSGFGASVIDQPSPWFHRTLVKPEFDPNPAGRLNFMPDQSGAPTSVHDMSLFAKSLATGDAPFIGFGENHGIAKNVHLTPDQEMVIKREGLGHLLPKIDSIPRRIAHFPINPALKNQVLDTAQQSLQQPLDRHQIYGELAQRLQREGDTNSAALISQALQQGKKIITVSGSSRGDLVAYKARKIYATLRRMGQENNTQIVALLANAKNNPADMTERLIEGLPIARVGDTQKLYDAGQGQKAMFNLINSSDWHYDSTGASQAAESLLSRTPTGFITDYSKANSRQIRLLQRKAPDISPLRVSQLRHIDLNTWNKYFMKDIDTKWSGTGQGLDTVNTGRQLRERLQGVTSNDPAQEQKYVARAQGQLDLARKSKAEMADAIIQHARDVNARAAQGKIVGPNILQLGVMNAKKWWYRPTSSSLMPKTGALEYGIADKSDKGDMSKLEAGKLYDYVIQHHLARRAGEHKDFRFGNKDLGMFSFATKKDLPTEDNQKIKLFQQPVHTHAYKDFEGQIGTGYGAGHVRKASEGKILVTSVKPSHISFTFADKPTPARYTMVKLKQDKEWLLIKHGNPKATGVEKPKYVLVPKDKIFEKMDDLKEGDVVQPKVDGALTLITMGKNIEMLSHRISKRTGDPVVHTERFFRKTERTPEGLEDSTLLGEMYGKKKDKVIHPSELGGILNSAVGKSIESQDEKGINLKTMIFDIVKHKGQPVKDEYPKKLELLQSIVPQLPKDKFHLPESASTKEEAIKLLKSIMAKKYPLTSEGIILHAKGEKPVKLKLTDEHNVIVRDIFEGEGKYTGHSAGGFRYSWTPEGEIVGKVGTGLNDALRRDMFANPDKYIGRTARVQALEKNKAGILQKPSFIALDESRDKVLKQSMDKEATTISATKALLKRLAAQGVRVARNPGKIELNDPDMEYMGGSFSYNKEGVPQIALPRGKELYQSYSPREALFHEAGHWQTSGMQRYHSFNHKFRSYERAKLEKLRTTLPPNLHELDPAAIAAIYKNLPQDKSFLNSPRVGRMMRKLVLQSESAANTHGLQLLREFNVPQENIEHFQQAAQKGVSGYRKSTRDTLTALTPTKYSTPDMMEKAMALQPAYQQHMHSLNNPAHPNYKNLMSKSLNEIEAMPKQYLAHKMPEIRKMLAQGSRANKDILSIPAYSEPGQPTFDFTRKPLAKPVDNPPILH